MPDPPAATFDTTIGELEAIVDRCSADDDRIGYFGALYLSVTNTMRARASSGQFGDPVRMERFVTTFAHRYIDALDAWRSGAPCSMSWRAAFAAAGKRRPIILQHLLLGMNAHINLDLGVAAADVGAGAPLDAIKADFDAVNDVLGQLVDGCQGALDSVSPWCDLVDKMGGDGDETVIRFSLVAARRQAWSVATRLSALTGAARDEAVTSVDTVTAGVADAVEHPGVAASALLLVVRSRERADPAEVIRVLRSVHLAAP